MPGGAHTGSSRRAVAPAATTSTVDATREFDNVLTGFLGATGSKAVRA